MVDPRGEMWAKFLKSKRKFLCVFGKIKLGDDAQGDAEAMKDAAEYLDLATKAIQDIGLPPENGGSNGV